MKAVLVLGGLAVLAVLGSLIFDDETSVPKAPAPTAVVAPAADTPEQRQAKISALATEMVDPNNNSGRQLLSAEELVRVYPESPESTKAIDVISKIKAEMLEAARGQQWTYGTFSDSMSGKEGARATVISTNSFEFDFPYQGRQNATLTVRRHPRWGHDVIFAVEKGQILCGISDCEVKVRFDDGQARSFSATEPADNSTESVFLPAGAFTKAMEKAKIVRIEVHIFQQGVLTAEFDVDGFKPERLKPGATPKPQAKTADLRS